MAFFFSSLARRNLHPLLRPFSASAFDSNLLRLLRSDVSYHCEYRPPLQPPSTFGSFSIEDRPGEQWIRLRRRHGAEEIKIDATMFDGAAPSVPESASMAEKVDAIERGPRLHISLIVEVAKVDEGSESVVEFICSAWPEVLQVQKVFPIRKRGVAVRPYTCRDFRKLEKGLQNEMVEYLAEREIDDELANFLHEYMTNKDKAEVLRWLLILESFVQKQSST